MMQGHWEKEFREQITRYISRKFGITPGRVTIGIEDDAASLQARMATLPMGRPVQIQGPDGSPLFLAGLDGPSS